MGQEGWFKLSVEFPDGGTLFSIGEYLVGIVEIIGISLFSSIYEKN